MADAESAADWRRLAGEAAALGVLLSPDQLEALRRYLELLRDWNRRFNLTAIERPDEVLIKHFLDSLTCSRTVVLGDAGTLVDVGTGAGFPGLVLKIAFPHLRITLLDALQKRLRFLERVVAELGLRGVSTEHARAEDAGRDPRFREAFDVVTTRAVARLNVLAEWTVPLARRGGVVVAMKGPDVAAEAFEASRAVRLLGGGELEVSELRLPGTDIGRSLVRISKIHGTPPAYPRAPGAARKHPL